MLQEKIKCAVLMPFEKSYSFVYESIKAACNEFNSRPKKTKIESLRADDDYTSEGSKLESITTLIANCNIGIIDITGSRPNVLWEFGYCVALNKKIIILLRKGAEDKIPFNVSNREFISYEFSVDGLNVLKENLVNTFLKEFSDDNNKQRSLRFDPDINTYLMNIENGLRKIEFDSLLQNLAKGEFQRLNRRIKDLQKGKFDLRNRKPRQEIIQYYSDYVSQLNESGCEFYTITRLAFWKEITDEGKNSEYFIENVNAVLRGTSIKRVFLFSESELNSLHTHNRWLLQTLRSHCEESTEYEDKFEVKFYVSKNFKSDAEKYPNLAIWKKDTQQLLFFPTYLQNSKQEWNLKQTDFVYFRNGEGGYPKKNLELINKHSLLFKRLWEKAQTLTQEKINGWNNNK
ncbi:MAG: hypothetical protein AAF655_22350 [Bacteroidota bacterium]